MSVHKAGIRPPQNEIFKPVSGVLDNVEQFTNHFDDGLLQADKTIHSLIDELKEKGCLGNSLVVITSNHGQFLGEKRIFDHAKRPQEVEIDHPASGA